MVDHQSDIVNRFNVPEESGEPVFREPWEAQAFALTLHLFEAGHFTWDEWATTLSEKIKEAHESGDPDDGTTYYSHWLSALETLVVSRELSNPKELNERKDAWDLAVRNTPHGKPIELGNAKHHHHSETGHHDH